MKTAKRIVLALIFTQACLFVSAITDSHYEILAAIQSNEHLSEGQRLQKLANRSFLDGDYDAASKYAEEAAVAAALSDTFVQLQLKIYAANNKLDDALRRLSMMDAEQAERYFSDEFNEAKTYYSLGLSAKDEKQWDDTISSAEKVIELLAYMELALQKANKETDVLPAQYTVGSWNKERDCFWNIAGRSWAYSDPLKWPILYQANKKKLPNPDNPDLIKPGTVLDIPSIRGEKRSGLWDAGKVYSPK